MHQVNALMEGQRIQLEDRRNCTWSRTLNIKKHDDSDEEEESEAYYTSQVYHNYSFRFARPKLPGERVQHKLNVKELKLPITLAHVNYNNNNNHHHENYKQNKKRHKLGLKPLKLLTINTKQRRQSCEACKNLKKLKILEEANSISDTTDDYQEEFTSRVNYDINDVDFDFDVLRLIMNEECNNNSDDDYNERSQKISNQVNTALEDSLNNKSSSQVDDDQCNNNHIRGKKIRFTLSKPQSPRTVQVIRVDVRSNAYAPRLRKNNENISNNHQDGGCSSDDEDDYCRRFRRDYGLSNCNHDHYASCNNRKHGVYGACANDYDQKDTIDHHVDLALLCKKVTLSPKK